MTSVEAHDVIVLGSSPNELVCACLLAKAGRKVTVIERRSEIGGTSAFRDVAPGFRLQPTPPHSGWVAPKIIKELGLESRGFVQEWSDVAVVTPQKDGPALVLHRDLAKSRAEIAKHSERDAKAFEPFAVRMHTLAGFLETLYEKEPPRITSDQVSDLLDVMAAGLRLRRLGASSMIDLLRTLPMSVQDLLDDTFENDLLKATIGAGGITNLLQGPRSAGTCFVLLHHLVGRPLGAFRARAIVKSENGHLLGVLERTAKELGVSMKTGEAARILVKDGRAHAVILGSGVELTARTIVSGFDPKTTFLSLVDPTELDPELVRAVTNVKLRGARAMVNLALDSLPRFRGVPENALGGIVSIGDHLDYLERAYDDAKHGEVSKNLVLEASIPSLTDPSLAPPGKHVMSVAVQYVPHRVATSEALADRVIATLAEYAPGLEKSVVGRALFGPKDFEEQYGCAEGNLYGGELTLDQILFMRPLPGLSHYATPLEGLFMCGSACHPGGGLHGLAGANAAREVLKR